MDLSWWLTTLSLGALAYAGVTWVNRSYVAPLCAARAAQQATAAAASVKRKRHVQGFKPRSARSARSKVLNAGSGHQDAVTPSVHVQPNVQRSETRTAEPVQIAPAAPAPGATAEPSDRFTLTPREMVQLGEALNLYRDGDTIEQAVCTAFGVTKGGSEGWKRAKGLFDAATVPPGAAPERTYVAVAPVKRSRRRV
jgi:hypothetical protein